MNNTIPYTYLIRHKESRKYYQGSKTSRGCNPDDFLKEDGYLTSSKIIKKIIENEGIGSFEIISLDIFDDVIEARLAEVKYHSHFDVASNIEYYNQHNAGEKFTTTGKPISEEHKKKISNFQKGKPKSKEANLKNSISNTGRKVSEETRKKISDSKKGTVQTEEHKRKNSEANKGRKVSEETRGKISTANKGKTRSEEYKKKLSELRTGDRETSNYIRVSCIMCKYETTLAKFNQHYKYHHEDDGEYKAKISNSAKKSFSEETRSKLSKSQRERGSNYIRISCIACKHETTHAKFQEHLKKHDYHYVKPKRSSEITMISCIQCKKETKLNRFYKHYKKYHSVKESCDE